MRFDVLVVEDESALLRGIVRGLEADPAIHATGVPTVERAIAILEKSPPDLLITDIRLPGRSGLDLLLEIENRDLRIPVIVMTAFKSAYEEQLSSRSGLTVLEKPVPISKLRQLVKDKLAAAQEAGSPAGPFALVDYLQLASLGRHSLRFRVETEDGREGHLEVVEGALWNVFLAAEEAADALATMIRIPIKHLGYVQLGEVPSIRQLEGSTEGLLLDIATLEDQERRDEECGEEGTVNSEAVFEGAYRPPEDSFEEETAPSAEGEEESIAIYDEAASEVCRRMVREVTLAHACGIVDLAARRVVGAHEPTPASSPIATDPMVVPALRLFESEADSDGVTAIEALVSSEASYRFFEAIQDRDLVAVLLTDPSIKQGLGWMSLRHTRAFGELEIRDLGVALMSANQKGSTSEISPGELDDSVSRACQRVATEIEGARVLAVVDFARVCLAGSSLPESRPLGDLSPSVLAAIVDMFQLAIVEPTGSEHEADYAPPEEVFVAYPDSFLFVARIPSRNLLAALSTDRTITSGVGRISLRDALPVISRAAT